MVSKNTPNTPNTPSTAEADDALKSVLADLAALMDKYDPHMNKDSKVDRFDFGYTLFGCACALANKPAASQLVLQLYGMMLFEMSAERAAQLTKINQEFWRENCRGKSDST
jgi:hypothetical protein